MASSRVAEIGEDPLFFPSYAAAVPVVCVADGELKLCGGGHRVRMEEAEAGSGEQ